MSSQKQIDANRRNARLSTGPTTPEGKAAVSQNRLSHGLRARDPVLPGENQSEYDELLAGCLAHFQPADAFEEALVRQLASAEWRLRRIARIEAGLLFDEIEYRRERENWSDDGPTPECTEDEQRYDSNTRLLGRVFARNAGGDRFITLMRYENSLRRAFHKALEQLNARPPRPVPAGPAGPQPVSDRSNPISTGGGPLQPRASASVVSGLGIDNRSESTLPSRARQHAGCGPLPSRARQQAVSGP